jgi:hypothetical protein
MFFAVINALPMLVVISMEPIVAGVASGAAIADAGL